MQDKCHAALPGVPSFLFQDEDEFFAEIKISERLVRYIVFFFEFDDRFNAVTMAVEWLLIPSSVGPLSFHTTCT